jgi:hypothetical protein
MPVSESRSWLSVYAPDARGRNVPLISVFRLDTRASGERGLRRRMMKRIFLATLTSPRYLFGAALVFVLLTVPAPWLALHSWRTEVSEVNRILFDAAVGAFAALGFLIAWRMERAFIRRQLPIEMLRERRCPSCGYHLTGVLPADDECTVCPECGAAWRCDA